MSPHSGANSALEGVSTLGEHPVVYEVSEWDDGVLHSTIGSFKGLEANVVILIDINPRKARCSRNDRYVAASRAVHRLHIFAKGDWLE